MNIALDDILLDGEERAVVAWRLSCDELGALVVLGHGIIPGRMPPAPWRLPRVTPGALRDLAAQLVKLADDPPWWLRRDEAPP